MSERLDEIRARVEAAKSDHWDLYCWTNHYPFVRDAEGLLRLVDSLTKDRDDWRAIADHRSNSIAAKAAELIRLRAVVEEARDKTNEIAVDYGFLQDHGLGAALDEVTAILDRVKGEGE